MRSYNEPFRCALNLVETDTATSKRRVPSLRRRHDLVDEKRESDLSG